MISHDQNSLKFPISSTFYFLMPIKLFIGYKENLMKNLETMKYKPDIFKYL